MANIRHHSQPIEEAGYFVAAGILSDTQLTELYPNPRDIVSPITLFLYGGLNLFADNGGLSMPTAESPSGQDLSAWLFGQSKTSIVSPRMDGRSGAGSPTTMSGDRLYGCWHTTLLEICSVRYPLGPTTGHSQGNERTCRHLERSSFRA